MGHFHCLAKYEKYGKCGNMEKCRICKIQRQSELNTSLYFSTPNFMRRTSIIRRLTVTEHKMTKSNIQTRRKNQTISFFLRLEKSLQQDLLSTRNSLKERKLPKKLGYFLKKKEDGRRTQPMMDENCLFLV